MQLMRYEITLPADYDMGVIHRRVATRGSGTDRFPGLGIKAYLVRERGRHGSPVNQYAPFYLWAELSGMNAFLRAWLPRHRHRLRSPRRPDLARHRDQRRSGARVHACRRNQGRAEHRPRPCPHHPHRSARRRDPDRREAARRQLHGHRRRPVHVHAGPAHALDRPGSRRCPGRALRRPARVAAPPSGPVWGTAMSALCLGR